MLDDRTELSIWQFPVLHIKSIQKQFLNTQRHALSTDTVCLFAYVWVWLSAYYNKQNKFHRFSIFKNELIMYLF